MSESVLEHLPARTAGHYCVFPLGVDRKILKLAVPEDFSKQSKEELRILLGREIDFVPHPRRTIEDMIARHYGVGAGVIESLAPQQGKVEEDSDIAVLEHQQDPTITALINELFMDALRARASDIHIEPFERSLRIRYRVDGLLQDARVSSEIRKLAPHLISKIKIMSKLDIGEKRLPQDGRIKIRQKNEELDLRVSVLPSSFGEAVVIRILKPLQLLELQDLGFEAEKIGEIRELLQKPHGVVLVTGPTGSGKTTTLYSCLKELNGTERKIITIEDPVEYKLHGVLQMQVNPKIDFTFARALRSILRHDPDCIMIGEIRDGETAEIAIRSALTGHLVFSTIHTNDAPSAVTRLVEMGIEPYLVAQALEGVVAQRLVRKFCYQCQGEYSADCIVCGGAGFHGRLAVSEIMTVTDEIRDLVLEKKTGSVLRQCAVKNGMTGLFEDGMLKVRRKMTDEKEIRRAVPSA